MQAKGAVRVSQTLPEFGIVGIRGRRVVTVQFQRTETEFDVLLK